MNVLIIGGAGFVGGYLAESLIEAGHNVFVTKVPSTSFEGVGVQVFDADILNENELEYVFNASKPDAVFNLAAISSVALSWKKPQNTVDINIKGTINILERVKESFINAKVILIGSGEEYGRINAEDLPLKECTPLRPANIYAATKVCQEELGRIYHSAYGMNIIMTRSFNHFGPRQSHEFVVSAFCKQVAEIEKDLQLPVINVGNLSAKRDFLDVRDVVSAYILLITHGINGEVYNVGGGKAVEIKFILDKILSLTNKKIMINIDKNKLRPVDIPIIEANISKITKDTGWKPSIILEKTIEDTLNYWRKVVL